MKTSVLTYTQKLAKIEHELLKLKKGPFRKPQGLVVSMRGMVKGVKITEQDIAAAKKSLFRTKE